MAACRAGGGGGGLRARGHHVPRHPAPRGDICICARGVYTHGHGSVHAHAHAHVRLQRCPCLLRGDPRGVPTYCYQACGGGTMVWDYPEALEVIRSEQAAGCVAAVLCGHAACEFEAPCHMLHPATAASWGGLSRDTLLSDPLRRSRLAAQGPARGCEAVVRPVRSRQIRGYPPPRPRPLRRVPPRRARRAPLYLLLAAQQVLTLLSSSGADLLLELTSSTLLAFCSPLNSTATHLPTALLRTSLTAYLSYLLLAQQGRRGLGLRSRQCAQRLSGGGRAMRWPAGS